MFKSTEDLETMHNKLNDIQTTEQQLKTAINDIKSESIELSRLGKCSMYQMMRRWMSYTFFHSTLYRT